MAETSRSKRLPEEEWTRRFLRQQYVTNRVHALQRVLSRDFQHQSVTFAKLLEYFREMCRQAERIYP